MARAKEKIDKLFVYKKDLDENGIVYFLGTNFGTETWQNPSERGLIKLNSSGWDAGSINSMVGRTPDNSWAAPTQGVWVIIDFGTSLYIKPNKYTLRDIFDRNHMLSWSLEGANEFLDWTSIKQHTNDQSMNHNGDKTHSWNINECHNYFSKFRIKMNDKNTQNNWYYHSTGFEIYGHLMGKQKYIKNIELSDEKEKEEAKQKQTITELETTLKDYDAKMQELKKEYSTKIETLKSESENQTKAITQLKEQLTQKDDKLSKLNNEATEFEKEISVFKDKISELTQQLKTLQNEYKDNKTNYDAKIRESDNETKTLKHENKKQKNDIEKLNQEITKKEDDNIQKKEEIGKLKEELSQQKINNDHLFEEEKKKM